MCESIRFNNGQDVGTVRQFQETFNVDATKYGWDGNDRFLDTCLCGIDLEQFFKDNPQHRFYYEIGEWWEKQDDLLAASLLDITFKNNDLCPPNLP